MKRFFIILIGALIISCTMPTGTVQSGSKSVSDGAFFKGGIQPYIAITGDSRAYGNMEWPQLPNQLINVSRPGTTTKFALSYIDELAATHPAAVFIFCGINDVTKYNTDFQSDLLRISISCYLNGSHLYIMDQSFCASKCPIPGLIPYFDLAKSIMQSVPLATYIPIDYVDDDFVDYAHLQTSGYVKIFAAINNVLSQ